jgi:TatA/E family protein of Tat protein translocase
MFDIGFSEMLIILVVALLVLGPKRLPEIARSLGRGLAEFRRTSEDIRRSVFEDDEHPRPSSTVSIGYKPPQPASKGGSAGEPAVGDKPAPSTGSSQDGENAGALRQPDEIDG